MINIGFYKISLGNWVLIFCEGRIQKAEGNHKKLVRKAYPRPFRDCIEGFHLKTEAPPIMISLLSLFIAFGAFYLPDENITTTPAITITMISL